MSGTEQMRGRHIVIHGAMSDTARDGIVEVLLGNRFAAQMHQSLGVLAQERQIVRTGPVRSAGVVQQPTPSAAAAVVVIRTSTNVAVHAAVG